MTVTLKCMTRLDDLITGNRRKSGMKKYHPKLAKFCCRDHANPVPNKLSIRGRSHYSVKSRSEIVTASTGVCVHTESNLIEMPN